MIKGQIRRNHLRGQYTTLNCHVSYTNVEYDMKLCKTLLLKFNLIKYSYCLEKKRYGLLIKNLNS